MLSDDTIRRMKAIKSKVDEVMRIFDVPEDRAWIIVTASDAEKVAEVAERIDRRDGRQRGIWQAISHGFGVTKAEVDKLFKE